MARAQRAVEGGGRPGELVDEGASTVACLGLGQAQRGQAVEPVGGDVREHLAGARAGNSGAVGGDAAAGRQAVRGGGAFHEFVGHQATQSGGHGELALDVSARRGNGFGVVVEMPRADLVRRKIVGAGEEEDDVGPLDR
ncbi:hypothetical protein ACFV2Z_34660 [Streptomyces sp. NPDC059688]|uniref:hypothetical protein n=1 Tax=Streptomyces sp. NPDC059688 TaxID=3346906 RepID=UPI0036C9CBB5